MKPRVLCVGNAVADAIARPVEALPPPGALRLTREIALHPGGNAVNTSLALSRLGVQASAAIAIGRDGFGDYLLGRLAAAGVRPAVVVRHPRLQTSATVVTVTRKGERSFTHVLGAGAALTDRKIPLAVLKRHDHLHLCGFFIMPGLDGRPAARLLARARRLGLSTTLNTSGDPRGRAALLTPCLPHVDWLLVSVEEARAALGGGSPAALARRLLAMGVRRGVVLTLGPGGSLACPRDGAPVRVPAFRTRVVDATGAGDCFCAGFIAGLLRGRPPSICARLGNAASALSVAGLGGQGRLRSSAQLRRLAGLS